MKATLEFDLEDHFEKLAHRRAMSATDAYIVIHKFDEYLRSMLKWDDSMDDVMVAKVERIRKELIDLCQDCQIDLDDLP
jgi:hypothetical protein